MRSELVYRRYCRFFGNFCSRLVPLSPSSLQYAFAFFFEEKGEGPPSLGPPNVIVEYDDKNNVKLKGYKSQGIDAALIPRDS